MKNTTTNKFSSTASSYQKRIDPNNATEFPSLDNSFEKTQPTTKAPSLNFKNASLIETEVLSCQEKILPGWTSFTFETGKRKVKIDGHKEFKPEEESFSVQAKRVIQCMVDRWDKFKEDYIELYGEDTYHNMFSFPIKEQDDLIGDDILDDESNDENDYCDEEYEEDY